MSPLFPVCLQLGARSNGAAHARAEDTFVVTADVDCL
jgi:hypothetical protein